MRKKMHFRTFALSFILVILTFGTAHLIPPFGAFSKLELQDLLRWDDDVSGYIFYKVGKIKTKESTQVILTMGGSSFQSFVPNYLDGQQLLNSRFKKNESYQYLEFTKPRTRMIDYLIMLHQLPKFKPGSILFLHANPEKFMVTEEENLSDGLIVDNVPFISDIQTRLFLLQHGYLMKKKSHLSDTASFFTQYFEIRLKPIYYKNAKAIKPTFFELLKFKAGNIEKIKKESKQLLRQNQPQYQMLARTYQPKKTDEIKSQIISELKLPERLNDYNKNSKLNFLILKEVIRVAKAKNMQIVLVVLPGHSLYFNTVSPIFDTYYQALTKMLENDVYDLNLFANEFFNDSNFFDATHSYQTGKDKFKLFFLEKIDELRTQKKIKI